MQKQIRHKGPVLAMNWRITSESQTRLAVGPGALGKAVSLLGQIDAGRRVMVISPENFPADLTQTLTADLQQAKYEVFDLQLPEGEECKDAIYLLGIWKSLQNANLDRFDTIIAVGGGALTDVVGFAASTYLRGINLVLIPTTLLAQVDAAIGGKTAVNLEAAKNLAGTFYFPQAVIVDPDLLASLDNRSFRSGVGEIIKYAFIEETVSLATEYQKGPRSLLSLLEENLSADFDFENPLLTGIIISCIKMKLAVVGKDPHEQSLRRVLNLGHTLGHAVEKLSEYTVSHGEAVAIGLMFCMRLSVAKGRMDAAETDRVGKLLKKAGLPTEIPENISKDRMVEVMRHDKKRQGDKIRFVLPNKSAGLVDFDAQLSFDDLSKFL
jgi:3-dehydroquinate synthase